ncbi:T9SS type A sorting domain-containing protein [Flammeovirga aprica]|uniref:Secretion system C-terminal sorting domain-containing protein n=1 Tax=Flammeovirga aprica JL-4 TaxID=694437 RepID=A0A7X9NZY5_9BACT|nr:T9SS type A sorting domain-containing protein [Flammeovirga aprica]NME66785.1 hypothetical protein [Flammeovirga aprica JL-4]
MKYNKISSTAANNNYYLYQNEQLIDNYASHLNPFEEKYFFSAYLPQQNVYRGELKLQIKSDQFFSNHEGTLSSIEFDAGNGLGYQSITIGEIKKFSYSSTGSKTWKLRVRYHISGHIKTYETKGKTYVLGASCSNCRYTPSNVDLDTTITSKETFWFSEQPAQGRVRVYMDGTVLDKPLIVFGGFGFPGMEYGDRFVQTWANDTSLEGPLQIGVIPTTLNDDLFNNGYDIVFVDYIDAGDYIQNNALLAESVIEWVNDEKANAGSTEPNVVMGISMGGLVANYALRSMELDGVDHDTRLLMTMDSPHRGANIPLSLIALVQRGIEIYGDNIFHSLRPYQKMFFTNSARQMLINYVSAQSTTVTKDNSMHEAFMNDYHGRGRPQNCRVVALSNSGNNSLGNNWNGINPGDDLIDISASCRLTNAVTGNFGYYFLKYLGLFLNTKGSVSLNLKALSSQSEQITDFNINFKVKVLLVWEKTIYNQDIEYTSENGELPWDSAHGGLIGEGFGEVPNLNEEVDELDLGCININENLNNFYFIPQVSALNITPANNGKYTEAQLKKAYTVTNDLDEIPFDNIYTEPLGNQLHTRFTQAAGDFIWNEIDNVEESRDHAIFSSFVSNLQINSSDCISSNGSVSLSKTPPSNLKLHYKWEVIGVNSYTLSENNSPTNHISGVVDNNIIATIKCTISGPYNSNGTFNWEKVILKNVTSRPSSISVSNIPYSLCYDTHTGSDRVIVNGVDLSVENIVVKTYSGSARFGYYISGTSIYIYPYQQGFIYFDVETDNNTCGSNTAFVSIRVDQCGGGEIHFFPVPTSETLTITLQETESKNKLMVQQTTPSSNIESMDNIYTLVVINDEGENILVLNDIQVENGYELDVSSLKNGFYYLSLVNENRSLTKRFEVRK